MRVVRSDFFIVVELPVSVLKTEGQNDSKITCQTDINKKTKKGKAKIRKWKNINKIQRIVKKKEK